MIKKQELCFFLHNKPQYHKILVNNSHKNYWLVTWMPFLVSYSYARKRLQSIKLTNVLLNSGERKHSRFGKQEIPYCLKLWPERLFFSSNFSPWPLNESGDYTRLVFITSSSQSKFFE